MSDAICTQCSLSTAGQHESHCPLFEGGVVVIPHANRRFTFKPSLCEACAQKDATIVGLRESAARAYAVLETSCRQLEQANDALREENERLTRSADAWMKVQVQIVELREELGREHDWRVKDFVYAHGVAACPTCRLLGRAPREGA